MRIKRRLIVSFAITLLVALFFAGQALAGSIVHRTVLFSAESVAANGSVESGVINFVGNEPAGYMSLQLEVTGDGTVKVEPLLSNDGANFLLPSGVSAITTGFTKTSGPDGDGKDMFVVDPGMVSALLKIRVTETGGTNSATVTAVLVWQ